MLLLNKRNYDPIDDDSETGYRRPPEDPACVCDYFCALSYVEDSGKFAVAEMTVLMTDACAFFAKEPASAILAVRLAIQAEEFGLAAEDLDGRVHECKGAEATAVNNGGIESQLEYLLQGSDALTVSVMLTELSADKGKGTA